jgi:hypothetical protein
LNETEQLWRAAGREVKGEIAPELNASVQMQPVLLEKGLTAAVQESSADARRASPPLLVGIPAPSRGE